MAKLTDEPAVSPAFALSFFGTVLGECASVGTDGISCAWQDDVGYYAWLDLKDGKLSARFADDVKNEYRWRNVLTCIGYCAVHFIPFEVS